MTSQVKAIETFLGYVKISVAVACLRIKPNGKATKEFLSELIATYHAKQHLIKKLASNPHVYRRNPESVQNCESAPNNLCITEREHGLLAYEGKVWQLIHAAEVAENCDACVKALMMCSQVLTQCIGQKLSVNCIEFIQKVIICIATSNACQRIDMSLITIIEHLVNHLLNKGDTFDKLLSTALTFVGTGSVLIPMIELLLNAVKKFVKHILQQKLIAFSQVHVEENICHVLWITENLVPKLASFSNNVHANSSQAICHSNLVCRCTQRRYRSLDSSETDTKRWNTHIADLYSAAGDLINQFPLTAHYILHIATLLGNVTGHG